MKINFNDKTQWDIIKDEEGRIFAMSKFMDYICEISEEQLK